MRLPHPCPQPFQGCLLALLLMMAAPMAHSRSWVEDPFGTGFPGPGCSRRANQAPEVVAALDYLRRHFYADLAGVAVEEAYLKQWNEKIVVRLKVRLTWPAAAEDGRGPAATCEVWVDSKPDLEFGWTSCEISARKGDQGLPPPCNCAKFEFPGREFSAIPADDPLVNEVWPCLDKIFNPDGPGDPDGQGVGLEAAYLKKEGDKVVRLKVLVSWLDSSGSSDFVVTYHVWVDCRQDRESGWRCREVSGHLNDSDQPV